MEGTRVLITRQQCMGRKNQLAVIDRDASRGADGPPKISFTARVLDVREPLEENSGGQFPAPDRT